MEWLNLGISNLVWRHILTTTSDQCMHDRLSLKGYMVRVTWPLWILGNNWLYVGNSTRHSCNERL